MAASMGQLSTGKAKFADGRRRPYAPSTMTNIDGAAACEPDSPPDNDANDVELNCPSCHYNLRGLDGDTCPECGLNVPGIREYHPNIPWVYRRQLGRFRTFWRTVWMVTARNRQFREEVAGPVSDLDAWRFQLAVIAHVFAAAVAGVGFLFYIEMQDKGALRDVEWETLGPGVWGDLLALTAAFSAVWPVVVSMAGLLLYLWVATEMPGPCFRSKSASITHQNRLGALSRYACAPLALVLPVAPVAGVLAYCPAAPVAGVLAYCTEVSIPMTVYSNAQIVLAAAWTVVGAFTLWWFNLIRLTRATQPQSLRQVLRVGLATPILWVVCALLLVVGLPWAVLFVCVVIRSLA